ncbi:MAG: YdcF family protein [Ruminococcaceae bacterium]|nr:YdcF family protein [Oscillospiraceae bacterium]
MKRKSQFFIALGFVAIVLFTVISILTFGKSYTAYLPNQYNSKDVEVSFKPEGIAELKDVGFNDEYALIKVRSLKAGATDMIATVYNSENRSEYTSIHVSFTVLPTGVLYLAGFEYGGYIFTVIGMALLTVYSFAVCLTQFLKRRKSQFFSYKTMLDLALSVFFGLQGLMYSGLSVAGLIMPERAEGWQIYNIAGFIMSVLFLVSLPLLVIFAGFLSISNLSLIRHEGFGKNNLFGLFISLVLFIGSVACAYTAVKNPNSTDIELELVKDAVIRTVVSSAFVYFECILLSAVFCTQYAAKHEPKYNQDFIMILGCKVGRDSKPLPLLKGRIDRALDFYRNQLEKTGKKACFIPSGGKGSDETISEAECIKNYLVEQGIDESTIFPETESTTTLENMLFSKRIAEEHKKNANILFSTTNYHVFRSGMLSAKAGMRSDGIGAKTKWYFWPNAQMREFIGLIVSEWKINILLILAIVGVSTLFANISSLINFIVK